MNALATKGAHSPEAVRAAISSLDVDELGGIVAPWNFDFRQMAAGTFRADAQLTAIGGILLTNERWSRSIFSAGNSPPGCLALVGTLEGKPWTWNGVAIDASTVACGCDAPEVEFVTADSAAHWTLVVPLALLRQYLGEEMSATLGDLSYSLKSPAPEVAGLNRLIGELVQTDCVTRSTFDLRSACQRLLAAVESLLVRADDGGDVTTRRRYATYRKAVRMADKVGYRASVDELASGVGVSKRVLQLSFQENLGVSPLKFLKKLRLNNLHRKLRQGRSTNVSAAMQEQELFEYGRVAGEYRTLFGELPSETLHAPHDDPEFRFGDVQSSSLQE